MKILISITFFKPCFKRIINKYTLLRTILPTLNDVTFCYLSTLPLHWVNVSGNLNNQNQAVINWQVEETNVTRYETEKSNDGRTFVSVGNIASKGDGTQSYQFTDPVNVQATVFYRIKQIDKDGRFSYSSVVRLITHQTGRLSIYPNPATTIVTLTANRSLLNTKAVITDVNGKIMFSFTIENISSTLDLSNYANGVYILQLENGAV